jgi:hypothetical protein
VPEKKKKTIYGGIITKKKNERGISVSKGKTIIV